MKSRQSGVLEECELEEIRLNFAQGESVPMEVDSGGPVGRGAAFDYSQLEAAYKQVRPTPPSQKPTQLNNSRGGNPPNNPKKPIKKNPEKTLKNPQKILTPHTCPYRT